MRLEGRYLISRAPDGVWSGCVILQTAMGPVRLCASVREADIARVLAARMAAQGGVSAGFFQDIARTARKIARARLLRRMTESVNDVLKNKWVARAVGLVATVVPGYGQAIGAAYVAARTATTALRNAQSRDAATRARARQGIASIVSQATAGNPEAQQAQQVLQTVARGMRQETATASGMDPQRWIRATVLHRQLHKRDPAVEGIELAARISPPLLRTGNN